jgi:hypothetical protein
MKTTAQRIAHYNDRMLSSLLDPTLSAIQAMAVANFAAYANDFVPKQQQLRAILDDAGISTTKYALYEAFHGEIYHISKVASGDSAVVMASAMVVKYTTFGGVAATLKKIAFDIYTITVP